MDFLVPLEFLRHYLLSFKPFFRIPLIYLAVIVLKEPDNITRRSNIMVEIEYGRDDASLQVVAVNILKNRSVSVPDPILVPFAEPEVQCV